MGRSSGKLYCRGDYYTGARCRLSKVKPGEKCTVKAGGCPHCKELRCRAHCKCQGTAHATGRKAPRTQRLSQASSSASRAPAAAPAQAPLAPPALGRPPQSSTVEFLQGSASLKGALKDMQQASSVVLASYTYDDPNVQNLLLKRLSGRSSFSCVVLVDKAMAESGKTRFMRPRLEQLRKAGAEVFLCTGPGGRGAFHAKAIVIDNKTLYAGSANLTLSSAKDFDLQFKYRGPVVQDVMTSLTEARDCGRIMDTRRSAAEQH